MTRARTTALVALRLRVPASLAVTVVGASATLAMSFVGCESSPVPPPPADAGQLQKKYDAGPDSVTDGTAALVDALVADGSPDARPDAPPDARPDAPPDAPPDARPDAPPDAPRPIDAYVPPDTPVG